MELVELVQWEKEHYLKKCNTNVIIAKQKRKTLENRAI